VSRRRNPPDDIERAAELYREFREEEPRVAGFRDISLPEAVFEIGVCQFIGYLTTHAGKETAYVHGFAPGSQPSLYTSGRRSELLLLGGRFRMTPRGIVDLRRDGTEARALSIDELRALLRVKES
jgi:hypothetical protein